MLNRRALAVLALISCIRSGSSPSAAGSPAVHVAPVKRDGAADTDSRNANSMNGLALTVKDVKPSDRRIEVELRNVSSSPVRRVLALDDRDWIGSRKGIKSFGRGDTLIVIYDVPRQQSWGTKMTWEVSRMGVWYGTVAA